MEPVGTARLKPGRDKKIRNHYPWVQNGEIEDAIGVKNGQLVTLLDDQNQFLGIGTYNDASRFPIKVLTLHQEKIDQDFFKQKITRALHARKPLLQHTNAVRQIFAEADGLPGLIADQYADHLVVQVRSLGMEKLKPYWLPALIEATQATSVLERSDMAGRAEENLPEVIQTLHGNPPDTVDVQEHGLNLRVPIKTGLKTGYYVDQRNTRHRLAQSLKPGDKVLDCFCYSGGFSLHAARAGALSTGVDIHDVALETAKENARLNGLEIPFIQANVFEFLESEAKNQAPYDWIILDPPAISKTAETRDSLKSAVWKLVNLALPHLKPGGTMIVCSCSYQLSLELMLQTARSAAGNTQLFLDAVTIQDIDHPAPLAFPEALYLKCAWLRKEE